MDDEAGSLSRMRVNKVKGNKSRKLRQGGEVRRILSALIREL